MKRSLLLAITVGILLAAGVRLSGGQAQAGAIATGFGSATVDGRPVVVEVFVAVPAGVDASAAVRAAVREQGARPIDSADFKLTGLVWDQFSDSVNTNDLVTQYYNPSGDPTGGAARSALTSTQATWTNVASSEFTLGDGGNTTRCPSLVRQCSRRQVYDGFNDVGWADLGRCRATCTLGVTWYSTSTDEADMALNTRANWRTDGGNIDVETVLLHENGHVAGLGHSDVQAAVMYAYYQGVRRSLQQDDVNGISALYPQ